MNKLVVIGWLGSQSCYLNVPREEAERRYRIEWEIEDDGLSLNYKVHEFEFEDEFETYSAYPKGGFHL